MNIQQYYQQSAAASLNAGLAALIPPTILLIYSVIIVEIHQLLLLTAPFLLYSLFCYQHFLINRKRAEMVNISLQEVEQTHSELLNESILLLPFLPAPSLRLLLFTPNGFKAGELRDRSFILIRWFLPFIMDHIFTRKLGLYDSQDRPIMYYHIHRDRIELISSEGNKIDTIFKVIKGKKREFILGQMGVIVEKKGIPADYIFVTREDQIIAKIHTGMMPVEWGNRFINPNTPILRISESITESDKIQILALVMSIYINTDH